MGDKELLLLIDKAKNIIKSKQPKARMVDIEDAVQTAILRYLEQAGTVDTLTTAWLTLVGYRLLINKYNHDKRVVPLPPLILTEGSSSIVDLALDNPDLDEITGNLLYPK